MSHRRATVDLAAVGQEVFSQRTDSWMVGELRDVVDELEQEINRQC
ncbi:MAG TPA: hypothetical protein VED43_10325 [Mycobacterium sp.]|nr:hypothetical protein [Mycobacterium sp.]